MAVKVRKKKKKAEEKKYKDIQLDEQKVESALYVNQTNVTEDMINQFYKFYNHRIKRFDFYTYLLCGFVSIAVALLYIMKLDDYFLGIGWNIIINTCLIIIGINFFVFALKNKKFDKKRAEDIWNQNMSVIYYQYYFKDNELIIIDNIGETTKTYECIGKVYEAKKYYYIFTSSENAYILEKDRFVKGTNNRFSKFIRGKIGRNYKKRCIK